MADPMVRHQVYDRAGNVVEDTVTAKPVEQFNAETVVERAEGALVDNAAYLAIVSPTNAQAVAQTRALTRQVNALIRLTLNRFDSAD